MSTVRSVSWLLLLYALPSEMKAERVNLWRKLKKFGAIQSTSAYILPDESIHRERFQWLAQRVRDEGGEANLVQANQIQGLSDEQIVSLFNEERGRDYKQLISEAQALVAQARKGSKKYISQVERLRRRLHEIRAIDYFQCPTGHDAEMAVNRAAQRFSPRKSTKMSLLRKEQYRGQQWLTRPRPEIDRVGSAWLIQRCIDPEAQFVFAPTPADFPGAIPFDMPEVELTHHGDDCTFETLLNRFAISDPRLRRIGEMIHDADLEDGKFGRTECVGIDLVLKGLAQKGLTDQQILSQGFQCFEALYLALK